MCEIEGRIPVGGESDGEVMRGVDRAAGPDQTRLGLMDPEGHLITVFEPGQIEFSFNPWGRPYLSINPELLSDKQRKALAETFQIFIPDPISISYSLGVNDVVAPVDVSKAMVQILRSEYPQVDHNVPPGGEPGDYKAE